MSINKKQILCNTVHPPAPSRQPPVGFEHSSKNASTPIQMTNQSVQNKSQRIQKTNQSLQQTNHRIIYKDQIDVTLLVLLITYLEQCRNNLKAMHMCTRLIYDACPLSSYTRTNARNRMHHPFTLNVQSIVSRGQGTILGTPVFSSSSILFQTHVSMTLELEHQMLSHCILTRKHLFLSTSASE